MCTYEPNPAVKPDFIVSHSGTRHVIGEHAREHGAFRVTTCCRFGIRTDQEPVVATRDCPFCFTFLELGDCIYQLFADGRKVVHLREAADRLHVSQDKIATAVGGSPRLGWVSAYCHDQITIAIANETKGEKTL